MKNGDSGYLSLFRKNYSFIHNATQLRFYDPIYAQHLYPFPSGPSERRWKKAIFCSPFILLANLS